MICTKEHIKKKEERKLFEEQVMRIAKKDGMSILMKQKTRRFVILMS
jgi:hypothetical protein